MTVTAYKKVGRKYMNEYIPICMYRGFTIYFYPDQETNSYSYHLGDIVKTLQPIEIEVEDKFVHEAIKFILGNEAGGIKSVMYDIDKNLR